MIELNYYYIYLIFLSYTGVDQIYVLLVAVAQIFMPCIANMPQIFILCLVIVLIFLYHYPSLSDIFVVFKITFLKNRCRYSFLSSIFIVFLINYINTVFAVCSQRELKAVLNIISV